MDRCRSDNDGGASALLFLSGTLPGFGLFLLPFEFVSGQLQAREVAEGVDELKPELWLFFEALAELAAVESVQDVKEVKLCERSRSDIEL
jgi:hypothetical protein